MQQGKAFYVIRLFDLGNLSAGIVDPNVKESRIKVSVFQTRNLC